MHSSGSESGKALRQIARRGNWPQIYAVAFRGHIVGRPRQKRSTHSSTQPPAGPATFGLWQLQMQIVQRSDAAHLAEPDLLQRKFVDAQSTFRGPVAQKLAGRGSYRASAEKCRPQ